MGVDIQALQNAVVASAVPVNTNIVPASIYSPPVAIQKINSTIEGQSGPPNLLQFPSDRPKYVTVIQVADYTRRNLLVIGKLNVENTIILPFPGIMMDNQRVDYEEKALGLAGSAAQIAFNAAGREAGAGWDASGAAAAATIKNAASSALGAVAGSAGKAVGSALNSATNIAAAMSGWSPNEFLTVLMKGPTYKRPTFSWKFSPRNMNEAEAINQIILLLNKSMAPKLKAGGLIFGFPKIFQVGFLPNAGHLYKMKPAVLTDFNINYTPNGQPAMYRTPSGEDNPPESVEIKLQFMELEYWLNRAGDVSDFNTSNEIDASNGINSVALQQERQRNRLLQNNNRIKAPPAANADTPETNPNKFLGPKSFGGAQ